MHSPPPPPTATATSNFHHHHHHHRNNINNNKCFAGGVYKLTCLSCSMVYVGQTGEVLLRDLKNSDPTSRFAQHLSEYGPSSNKIENIMQILHFDKMETHMNTTEKFCLCKETIKDIYYNLTKHLNLFY
jgi:hypothetical protein